MVQFSVCSRRMDFVWFSSQRAGQAQVCSRRRMGLLARGSPQSLEVREENGLCLLKYAL